MREHKLGNDVNWQGVLKWKGVKRGLGVYPTYWLNGNKKWLETCALWSTCG